MLTCEVHSWKTSEEFCRNALQSRSIAESNGWTLLLDENNESFELMGLDYALDLISEMEIVPTFPVCKSFFLVSSNKTANRKRKNLNPNNIK